MSYKPNDYPAQSGELIDEGGNVKNIVTILGGGEPISDRVYPQKPARSGRVIGPDGKLYDLIKLLQNFAGGGGGGDGGPVTWPVPGTPTEFPPTPHNHDERYYTKTEIDNAGFLLANPDNETVEVQGRELKAKSLSGLQLAVSQLNAWLSGTEGNIQSQINDILLTLAALSAGMRYRGKFETKASLDSVTNKDNGDLAVVLADETRGGARSMYVYNEGLGLWDFIGAFEFSDAFTSLTDTPSGYEDGKLLRSGTSGLYFDTPKWAEIDGRPDRTRAQIESAADAAHGHDNKDNLDKINEDASGVLTYNGEQYVRVSDLPALQAKQRLFAYRSGSDQTLTAGTDCVFNTKHSGDIPYDPETGIFTLEAGKTYRVMVEGSLYTSGWVILQLVDAGTNSIVNTIARGIWMDVNPSNANWHESSAGPLKTYIVPAATRGYKIRATSVSGESSLRSNFMSLEIVEV